MVWPAFTWTWRVEHNQTHHPGKPSGMLPQRSSDLGTGTQIASPRTAEFDYTRADTDDPYSDFISEVPSFVYVPFPAVQT